MKQQVQKSPSLGATSRKNRIFRIVIIMIPVVFFVSLEWSLRLFDYGPNLSLFTTESFGGKSYYTLNPSVKNRYFGRLDFSPDPSPEYFLVSKPPGTYRIFCLGGSTTVGYPYWYNGAFSSFLRDRLKAIFPDRSIEIVNVGMTATNSYTVLDLSQDLVKYDPDLFVVYDGHNEFYGALGVASNERVASIRWITLLNLRLVHLRTFQLVKNAVSHLLRMFGKEPVGYSSRTTMMEQVARGETVPYGSDMYVRALDVFRENLESLVDLCEKHHIPLIFGTQVSRLRDQSPFVSNNAPGLSREDRVLFQRSYSRGLEFQSKGMLDSAIVLFHSAIASDSLYADVHYRLAQCLDVEGRRQEAYPEYILARDYDELRFRTDSEFNNLIHSMEDHEHCFVADIETLFKSLSQDSLIGRQLILEHLHPNARGHFLIAEEYARLMRDHHLLAISDEWTKHDTVKDEFLWEHRPLTDIDEFMAARKIELLTSGWPFTNESRAVASIKETDTLRFIADQAVHNQFGWVTAHNRAAEHYLRGGDSSSAEKEYETIINQLPLDVTAYLRLAQLCFAQKEFTKAETTLLASIQVYQTPFAYRALGDIYLKQVKLGDAIHSYEQLIRFPEDPATAPENAYMLALANLLSKKPEEATRVLERTVDRYPAYQPARELLSRIRLFKRTNPGR